MMALILCAFCRGVCAIDTGRPFELNTVLRGHSPCSRRLSSLVTHGPLGMAPCGNAPALLPDDKLVEVHEAAGDAGPGG